jgi:hypothetical protein
MNLVQRAKALCLSPDPSWSIIATERAETAGLLTGYVLPLAGAAATAQFIGAALVGQNLGLLGTYRVPLGTGIGMAVASLIVAAIGVVLLSMVIDGLAPTFGAEKNREQALKVAVYSATPVWVAGLLQILPALGVVVMLGAVYAVYLLYLGLLKLMKCPADKAVAYTATVVVSAVAIGLAGGLLTAAIPGVWATSITF